MNTTQAKAFYKKVDLAKLPADVRNELEKFDKDTKGFTNMNAQDFTDFKEIKELIEAAFPQAIKVPSDDDYRARGINPPGSKTSAIYMSDEEIAEYQKNKGKKLKRSKAKVTAKKVIKAKGTKAQGTKAKAAKRAISKVAKAKVTKAQGTKATKPKATAKPKAKFKVGDKVSLSQGFSTYQITSMRLNRNGIYAYKVKYIDPAIIKETPEFLETDLVKAKKAKVPKKAAAPKKVAAPKKAKTPRVKAAPKPKAVSVRAKTRSTSSVTERSRSEETKRKNLKNINADIAKVKAQLKETDKVKTQIAKLAQIEYNKIVSLGKTKLDVDLEKAKIQLKLYKTFLTNDKAKLKGIRQRAVGKVEPSLGKAKGTKKKGKKAGLRKRK